MANTTAIKKDSKITSTRSTKTAEKKTAGSKGKSIKYADKSAGQPKLVTIFDNIKAIMKPYAKGTIKERGEGGGGYSLVSEKPIEAEGRKKDEVYFAGILVQKGYVGFYFMPVYGSQKPEEIFDPALLKHLKGKSCFHIKKNDHVIYAQIENALKAGYDLYKQRGWV